MRGQEVAGPVDQAPLAATGREDELHGADQPSAAVGDDQGRGPQASGDHALEEGPPGVDGLGGTRLDGQQHRSAVAGHAPGDQHRLRPGAGVHLEVAAVQEQVLQLYLGQVPGGEDVELGPDRLAYPADRRLRHGRLGAQRLGDGRFHVANRQAPDEPGDHQDSKALVLVTPLPNRRDANGTVVPRSLGRRSVTGPAVVLTVRSL